MNLIHSRIRIMMMMVVCLVVCMRYDGVLLFSIIIIFCPTYFVGIRGGRPVIVIFVILLFLEILRRRHSPASTLHNHTIIPKKRLGLTTNDDKTSNFSSVDSYKIILEPRLFDLVCYWIAFIRLSTYRFGNSVIWNSQVVVRNSIGMNPTSTTTTTT